MIRTTALVLTLALLAAACSGSGNSEPSATTSTASTSTARPEPGDVDLVACESLDGTPTVDIDEFFDQGNACGVDRGGPQLEPAFLGIKDLECIDGTYLYWNDGGWGPAPGTWTASTSRRPPRDLMSACRGE